MASVPPMVNTQMTVTVAPSLSHPKKQTSVKCLETLGLVSRCDHLQWEGRLVDDIPLTEAIHLQHTHTSE